MGCVSSSSGGSLNCYVTTPDILKKTADFYGNPTVKVVKKGSLTKSSCTFKSDAPMPYGSRYLAYYNVVLLGKISYPEGTLTKGSKYGVIVWDTLTDDYLITSVDNVPLYLIDHSRRTNSSIKTNPSIIFGTFPSKLLVKSSDTIAVTTETA